MAIIKTPAAVDSPYTTTNTAPTVLRASADGTTVLAAATTTTTTTTSTAASTADVSYYATGVEGIAGLANQGRVFDGANVYVTLDQQNFNTTNRIDNPAGSNGYVQFNNGGILGGSANLAFDGANLLTGGIKTDNYYYANGSPFSGGGGSSYGNANVVALLSAFGSNTLFTTGNVTGGNLLTGGVLEFSGGSKLRPLGANLDIFAGAGSYVNLITADESSYMGVGGAGGYVVTAGGTWNFNTNGNLTAPGNVSAVGNITGGNVKTGGLISATGNVVGNNIIGAAANIPSVVSQNLDVENISARGSAGVNIGAGGFNNLVVEQAQVLIQNVPLSVSGNVTSAYFIGNGSQLTGVSSSSISNGTSNVRIPVANGNVTISANTSAWTFDNNGNLTAPGVVTAVTLSAVGNIIANNAMVTQRVSGANLDITGTANVGNLSTVGTVSANGNVTTLSTFYAGNGATWQSQVAFANVLFVGAEVGEAYIQAAIVETGGNGSADWVSYSNNGNTDAGWIDMGITGNTFSDPDYEITDPNDGYILVEGTNVLGTPLGGNLILATGTTGLAHDIVFATGGFTHANIKARLVDTTGEFSVVGNIVANNLSGTNLVINSITSDDSTFVTVEDGLNVVGDVDLSGNLSFSPTQVQSSAYAGGNGHMMMIDTNRTDTYVEIGSADKPFKTFSAAIAAVALENPSGTVPYTFVLAGCTINETVDFTPYNFNFITISTTCRSTFNNPVIFGNSALLQLTIRNVEFGDTVAITGDGTANQFNNTSIYNTSFVGALTVTAVNAIAFYEGAFFAPVVFNNVNYCYVNGGQFNDDWTIRVDDTGAYPIPSDGAAPGVVLALDFIANDINFVKGGTGIGVFQPHSSRMGRTGQTYALPTSWILTAYSSAFLGTWTNNGTWTMRNSVNLVTIANTAPTYSGTIGGTTITATGNVTGGNITTAGAVKTGSFVTGTIPAAAGVGAGARAFVTDADSVTFGNLYVGGAANAMPVWSNGTSWFIG